MLGDTCLPNTTQLVELVELMLGPFSALFSELEIAVMSITAAIVIGSIVAAAFVIR